MSHPRALDDRRGHGPRDPARPDPRRARRHASCAASRARAGRSRSRRSAGASRHAARSRRCRATDGAATRRGAWPPALQAGATGAGAMLVAYGLLAQARHRRHAGRRRRWRARAARHDQQAAARARSASAREVTVQQDDRRARSRSTTVFDLWSRLDNFPLFMQHVQEVDVAARRQSLALDRRRSCRDQGRVRGRDDRASSPIA